MYVVSSPPKGFGTFEIIESDPLTSDNAIPESPNTSLMEAFTTEKESANKALQPVVTSFRVRSDTLQTSLSFNRKVAASLCAGVRCQPVYAKTTGSVYYSS